MPNISTKSFTPSIGRSLPKRSPLHAPSRAGSNQPQPRLSSPTPMVTFPPAADLRTKHYDVMQYLAN